MNVFTFDKDGYIQWDRYRLEGKDYLFQKNETSVVPENGMIRPKWDGTKWVETGTAPPVLTEAAFVPEAEIMIAKFIIETEERLNKLEGFYD